jgi:hypothetical protein
MPQCWDCRNFASFIAARRATALYPGAWGWSDLRNANTSWGWRSAVFTTGPMAMVKKDPEMVKRRQKIS